MKQPSTVDFQRHLRHWRTVAKVSQMQLAMDSDLSTKHLNQLENGKTFPTQDTVLKLALALKLSFKNTNGMLMAAGFSPEFKTTQLNTESMAFTRYAIERTLENHNPFPAIVLEPSGEIIALNEGALKMMTKFLSPDILLKYNNVYELYFSNDGLKPYIQNWEATSVAMLQHVQLEILAIPLGAKGYDLFSRLERENKLPHNWQNMSQQETGVNSIFNFHFRKGDINMRFFSTYSTFGSPRDVALQDIRIECFFPADEETQKLCEAL